MKRSHLKRKTPLRAKSGALKRSPLRKVSDKQKKRLKDYFDVRRQWLQKHPVCEFCKHTNPDHPNKATEVHHSRGRNSTLICDVRFFVSCCRFHREFPHQNPALAREWGLLSSANDWNTPPKDF